MYVMNLPNNTYTIYFQLLDLSQRHLELKTTFCEELLEYLDNLKVGQSKLRGLLLYELYSCKREQQQRNYTKVGQNIFNSNICQALYYNIYRQKLSRWSASLKNRARY